MATSTTSTIAAPPMPSVPDISQYISTAQAQLGTGFSDVTNATLNQGATALSDANSTVMGLQQQQTTLQKTYSDLASELGVEQGIEQGSAEQQGQANIGGAKVAMAKSGVDQSATGAFAAPVAQAQNDLQTNIATIADKYGAKQQDIADTLAGNLDTINSQIIQAQNSGNEAYAAALTSVAQLKYQQNQSVISLAQQMQSAQTQYEQTAWTDYMDEVKAQDDSATLQHLAAEDEHIAIEDSQQSTATTNSVGGVSFTNSKGAPTTAASYAKENGLSIVDVLSSSNDPKDQSFIKDYNNIESQIASAQTSGDADTAIKNANAYLQQNYPQIVGQETLF